VDNAERFGSTHRSANAKATLAWSGAARLKSALPRRFLPGGFFPPGSPFKGLAAAFFGLITEVDF